jgi:hypothetical protein
LLLFSSLVIETDRAELFKATVESLQEEEKSLQVPGELLDPKAATQVSCSPLEQGKHIPPLQPPSVVFLILLPETPID